MEKKQKIINILFSALFAVTIGQAAVNAGTAIGEALGDGIEAIYNKVTGALIEITYKSVTYATELLTSSAISKLSKISYYLALANSKDGQMYFSGVSVDRSYAVSVVNFNTTVSIYTYYSSYARSVAQEAGNNYSPILEIATKTGYFNHYHTYYHGKAHVFYGTTKF